MKANVAILVSTFVLGTAIAQSSDPAASHSGAVNATPSAMMKSDAKRDAAVERHIVQMRAELKITPAEEAQWKEVAETMRENAAELDRAIDKRDGSIASATAIDNLNSYAEIAQAHANNVKKLASAFSGLYSVMSDEQRKEADEVFAHREHEGKKIASR
ncbi:MAG TPA: Spy/CpxP family protein refolding chaperone [Steroidobacteraceae bacterium]|nr:Spy/CpxP family protein refolding chaperone [Steroidobacteraceae bacterium]